MTLDSIRFEHRDPEPIHIRRMLHATTVSVAFRPLTFRDFSQADRI